MGEHFNVMVRKFSKDSQVETIVKVSERMRLLPIQRLSEKLFFPRRLKIALEETRRSDSMSVYGLFFSRDTTHFPLWLRQRCLTASESCLVSGGESRWGRFYPKQLAQVTLRTVKAGRQNWSNYRNSQVLRGSATFSKHNLSSTTVVNRIRRTQG